ncbi:MAG: radical SAM protein [Firmicutes bacterium]|nr:radical SAM protein [Bacillota bacterium]
MNIQDLANCRLCPRNCGANRLEKPGYCGAGAGIRAAKAMIHQGEEPCLLGSSGAGAIFFTGCNLRCVFCQNYEISWEQQGKEISTDRLGQIMLELQEQGAACIDLVTPTPYLLHIKEALEAVKPQLNIPVVYNCGGYEEPQALRKLDGLIDIYLPDLKYFDKAIAAKYSGCADYFERAGEALKEMFRQVGPAEFDENGQMKRGLLVRHLVLPGAYKDSMKLMDFLGEAFPDGSIRISLMSQYTPFGRVLKEPDRFKELGRRVTTFEYNKVIDRALANGLDGYSQQRSSSTMALRPDFDGAGL